MAQTGYHGGVDDPVVGVTTDAAPPSIAAPAYAPGVLIAGRYRLESRLGAGGGGTVWRCSDEKLATTVALKILGSAGELERWRREVAMARRIAHRNVCRVHDLGEADGLRFVTMELVDGVGLRARLGAGIGAEQARALFAQIVAGVAAIHEAGVVHRDLKPDNIVVASDGRAVIVDFGLAREPRAPGDGVQAAAVASPVASVTLTRDGDVVGTPRYMSPEQAAGDTVDARTDVWALGLIGHELITGALPAHGADGTSRVVDAAQLAAWPAIAPVLRTCLEVPPGARYPDARALLAALPIAPRRVRRALLAGAGIVVLAGVAGLGIHAATRDRAAQPPAADSRGPLAPPTAHELGEAFSVAVSPDGTEWAYTTSAGSLFVAPLAGGAAREWPIPAAVEHTAGGRVVEKQLVTTWTVGWFTGRSLAVAGISETGTWHLMRLFEDGRHTMLYSAPERFTVSAVGDVAAIGIHESGIYIVHADKPEQLEPIEPIASTEAVMAIAVAPDAERVAIARRAAGTEKAMIQVITPGGNKTTIWTGDVSNDIDQLLVWLDNDRLAFVHRPPPDGRQPANAILYMHDLRTHQTVKRYEWPAERYAGIGSAAHGELLVVGGQLRRRVAIGGARGERLAAVHDDAEAGALPAGWTSDGKLVFQLGDRVVRVAPGGTPETWPGVTGGERPNAVLGDDVIVHRIEGRETVIEKITARGTRKELHRMPAVDARYVVRCAGEREKPCFIETTSARDVTWRVFYPHTGELGRVLHKRLRREVNMQSAALSSDGTTLAIVEGTSELLLVDTATGSVRTITTGSGVELQTVAFSPDGELWATSLGYRGQFFGLLRFASRGGRLAAGPSDVLHGPTRFYWRPTPSPDGKYLAIGLLDFHFVVSRFIGV
jgi:serine/threonine-protein kinase